MNNDPFSLLPSLYQSTRKVHSRSVEPPAVVGELAAREASIILASCYQVICGGRHLNDGDFSSASRAREMKRCPLRLPFAGDSRAKDLLGLEASENSEPYRRCHVGNHLLW